MAAAIGERSPLEPVTAATPAGMARSKSSRDGLDAFAAEARPPARIIEWPRLNSRHLFAGAAIAAIGLAAGAGGVLAYQRWFAPATGSASLTIESAPSGLDVSIDGTNRGRTPLTLTLPPRTYEAVVGSGSDARVIKTTLAAGASTVQRIEFAAASAPAAPTFGILRIDTVPSALPIKVDGTERGLSPVTVQNITAGEHDVFVANGRESLRRKVSVHAGETLSLVLTPAPAAPASVSAGWLSIDAAAPLQIREDGKLLGSSESERLLMPAGSHSLEFVNAELGFSQRTTVTVTPGKVSAVRVNLPNGTLSINAQPWALVWVDGTRVGETPIGNLVRPIGRHEVVFRHPELGERRETVTITTQQPARLGVDLRRKTQ